MDPNYYKYLKYKSKYIAAKKLKFQLGGGNINTDAEARAEMKYLRSKMTYREVSGEEFSRGELDEMYELYYDLIRYEDAGNHSMDQEFIDFRSGVYPAMANLPEKKRYAEEKLAPGDRGEEEKEEDEEDEGLMTAAEFLKSIGLEADASIETITAKRDELKAALEKLNETVFEFRSILRNRIDKLRSTRKQLDDLEDKPETSVEELKFQKAQYEQLYDTTFAFNDRIESIDDQRDDLNADIKDLSEILSLRLGK